VSLDSSLLFGFLLIFARCSAMLLSSPLFGQAVPINFRVQLSGVVSMAMVPALAPHLGPAPETLVALIFAVGKEAIVGLIIGGFLQILLAAVQMAGSFLDVQVGIGSAQLFNPMLGMQASPIAQFKYMLGVVLLLTLNGHHLMFQAFAHSYSLAGPSLAAMPAMETTFVGFLGQVSLLAMQIAAPVAAVTIVVDVAAGLVNKAVPQTQPFLLALPAKLMLGLLVLALGLPAMASAIDGGLDSTFDYLGRMLGG
jgi:flagellar biosynthetic protein FliR